MRRRRRGGGVARCTEVRGRAAGPRAANRGGLLFGRARAVHKPGRSDGCLDGGLMRPCFGHDARRAMGAVTRGDEMGVFFLVPVSGGTAACILAVWLLSRLGLFGWGLLLLVVLFLAICIGVSVVSDRHRAVEERRDDREREVRYEAEREWQHRIDRKLAIITRGERLDYFRRTGERAKRQATLSPVQAAFICGALLEELLSTPPSKPN
jgi:hypothetical protein